MYFIKQVVPENFKPVAIIVKSQSSPPLPTLDEEVALVKFTLESNGFEVELLNDPKRETIVEQFSARSPYHDRIVVLHFAGHSNSQGMSLPDWRDAPTSAAPAFYFRGLAGFLREASSLRIVFINGCDSNGFENHFSRSEVGVVTCSGEIPDTTAKDFASRFYSEWAESETTVSKAFGHTKSWIESETSEDIPDSFRGESTNAQSERQFPVRLRGGGDTTLANCFSASFYTKLKESRIEWKSAWPSFQFTLVLLAALILATTSLYFAYFSSYSSPPFQASFGYAFNKTASVESASPTFSGHGFFVSPGTPTEGALYEFVRVVLGLLALYFTCWLLGPPFEVTLLQRGQFVALCSLLLFVICVVAVYNLHLAPSDLATDWKDKDNQWLAVVEYTSGAPKLATDDMFQPSTFNDKKHSYFCLDETVWKNAGKTCNGEDWITHYPDYKAMLGSIRTENHDLESFSELNPELHRKLYWHPYFAYLFYSLVLFVVVAVGLIFCVTIHTHKVASKVLFLLQATKGLETIQNRPEEQKKIANDVHKLMVLAWQRYSIFLCMLFGFACYEFSFGFLTLAFFAKFTTTVAAVFLLLVGSGLLGFAYFRYAESFVAADLNRLSDVEPPIAILKDPVVMISWLAIPAMAVYAWNQFFVTF